MTHNISNGPSIGHSSRLPYDNCAYPDKLSESTSPINYQLNKDYIHNCNRCLNSNGAGPRATTMGFGDGTLFTVGQTPANDLVDVDSICKNLNVKSSRCKKGKYNSVNLATKKQQNYNICTNFTNPEFSRLSYPASNYRDVSVNRFYNLHQNPQEPIFWDTARNSRLESKDNWFPDLPDLWEDYSVPKCYNGSVPKWSCSFK